MSGKYLFGVGLVVLSGCGAKPLGGQPAIDGSAPDATGQDARPADASTYPPPFGDAGCSGDPRFLVLYCETIDQLLGTDAGAVVTSLADCPPSSVLASPSPCAVGEGSCCVTPTCGPQIQTVSVSPPTPDASATENRCCYLALVACGV
jgi:hypothetical protein